MQVPSGWPRIFFVIYRRRKSVAKTKGAGGDCEGRTNCEIEMEKEGSSDGRAKWGGRRAKERKREKEKGREETGNLLPEDLLPLCARYRKGPL